MSEPRRIVIIGAGLAGASAAAALRDRGYDDALALLSAGHWRPYELPPLSKGILLGDTDDPDWVHGEDFYAEQDIELHLGTTASRIELGARVVLDADGGEHPYDRLLLATGARPRSLPVPGTDLAGVRTLRDLDDSRSLRTAFQGAGRVVIVGGGWIGTEAAAAARRHGADVTIVEQASAPLCGVLGDEVAGVFRDLHAEHGVEWRLGTKVTQVLGDADEVRGVRLDGGEEISGDVVLIAVGASPRVELAHEAGLELADDGGVSVDAGLRSSAPDVYAIGDVAAQFHPRYGRRVRVEHWANAKNQGAHVAVNLLGAHDPYLAAPYFFSEQNSTNRAAAVT